ncbi:MAG TPA: hypothetical protein VN962_13755 [Polyangia bacterium]|nr:hypothetical protein [Polyangia bacterium]
MRGFFIAAALVALATLMGCQSFPDPPVSFVAGLRVLGVKAEPPEAAPGDSATISALAVDTPGAAPDATWSACFATPMPGEAVNPDCVQAGADWQSVGQGLSITATMPPVSVEALGGPDVTGGVYLPLVADVRDATGAVSAVYRWRLAGSVSPNANPALASVYRLDAAGGMVALDPGAPTAVAAGDALSLGVTFADGSAQDYTRADGATVTEILTTSWFCTAGTLSFEKTSAVQPETVLHLDQRVPPSGSSIDLWAVARDERGGTDFAHRVLLLK